MIDYQKLLDEAMLELVKKVLIKIQSDGLYGTHHFYISFKTTHIGVILSPRMKQRYPEEITIVLQHQFDELLVSPDKFSVKISFDGIKENIQIPFSSITSFVDPSVKFSVQFKQIIKEKLSPHLVVASTEHPVGNVVMSEAVAADNIIVLDKFRNKNKKK